MQNLIYLILIVLSAGAGWLGGSWSGRDAKAALELAQKAGNELKASHDKLQAELDGRLKSLKAEHDAEVDKIRTDFASQTVVWNQTLAERDSRLRAANQTANSARQQADTLKGQLATAKSPQERQELQARLDAAQAQVAKAETESIGIDCSKRPVPAFLLAGLRLETP